jgi:Big-like domain-containing protein/PQQ enzyme-like repeat protein
MKPAFPPRQIVFLAIILTLCLAAHPRAGAQVSVTTYHNDNARTGQNLSETILTPANVNASQFGKLYAGSMSLDSWAAAQPLYVPNLVIPGQGTHNVVYVATLNNSIYAFDADSGQELWSAKYGDPTPFDDLCTDSSYQVTPYGGAGIVGTPVIDPGAGIIYFVTKTGNGAATPFALYLHAVYLTSGFDEPGSPVLISPPSGPTFMPQYQMNRPGLLLNNGTVYVALGSTGCKGRSGFPKINNHGWILGYNTLSLTQTPSLFVTSPTTNNGGIWQAGGGLPADSSGNIYVETADGIFDQNTGGSDYGLSVLKLDPNLNLLDFFTPYDEASLLNANDLDLSSVGPLVLPDQASGPTHLLVASGKSEEVYLLNRDDMGGFCSTCSTGTTNTNIVQDVLPPSFLSGCLGVAPEFTCRYGTPTFWNDNSTAYIYFAEVPGPLLSYSMTNGILTSLPASQSPLSYSGAGTPSISANGTSNAVLWAVTWANSSPGTDKGTLRAFDPANLQTQFYASSLAAGGRDTVGYVPDFVTPTIANGKVFVATQTQLLVYGLLPTLSVNAGNTQSGYVGTALPVSLAVQALNSYTGQPVPGVNITFTAVPTGGTFGSPTAITNTAGIATTTYTLPNKPGAITITASSSASTSAYFTETANAGPASSLTVVSGSKQKGTVGTTLPAPIVVSVKDPHGNAVSGISVNFTTGTFGGTFSPTSATTNSLGQASSTYTLPTKASMLTLGANIPGHSVNISEQSVAASPASLNMVSGNNQSAPPNTLLLQPLVVSVKDQYGNLVSGATVSFTDNGANGTLSSSSVITSANGQASVTYITPSQSGSVTITASISGLTPVNFTVTVQ